MTDKTIFYCSFCGKSEHEVFVLIAGPGVFICDECVAPCVDIVEKHRAAAASQPNATPLIEAIARAMYDEGDWPAWRRSSYYTDAAGEILTAIAAAGYAVVPREPTQDMISAGIIERHDQPTPEAWSLATENIYRAMISAAQGDG